MTTPNVIWDEEQKKKQPDHAVAWDTPLPEVSSPSAPQRFVENAEDSLIGTHTNEGVKEGLTVGLPHIIAHPIDSAKMIGNAMTDAQLAEHQKAAEYYDKPGIGNKIAGFAHGLYGSVPLVGPMLGKAATQFEQGDVAGGSGSMVGPASMAVAPKVPEIAKDVFSRVPKPRPIDVSAREVTKAVNPPVQEWNNYIASTGEQAGNIRDFALRNKLPLKTQLDWANAAKLAGNEANVGFKSMFDPIADTQVSVAGTGYRGATVGEGQRATLGDVYKRLGKINDELRAAYQKREGGQVRTALASEPELVAEREALTNVLHQEVARKSGITPEQVSELRRPAAQRYSIADETTSAVNQRQSSAGKAAEGRRDFPINVIGTIAEIGNKYLRGGPEGISNRAFRSAMNKSSFPVTEAPQIATPSEVKTVRTPLWLQNKEFPPNPMENPTFVINGPTEAETSRMATQEQNRATAKTARQSEEIEAAAQRKKNRESHGLRKRESE